MKRICSVIVCVLLLAGGAVGIALGIRTGPATGQPVPYPDSPITAITFHDTIDSNKGNLPVPEADLEEITNWLSSFTVGNWVGKTLVPGTGSVEMTLTYADGTSERRSLSIIHLDGVTYYINSPNAPACYLTLLNGN